MRANRNPKVTAAVTAAGLVIILGTAATADVAWPWRLVCGAISLLLIVKVVVAFRAGKPTVSHLEQRLRRLAFVARNG